VGLAANAKYADLHHAFLPTAFIPASQDKNPEPAGTFLVHSSLSLAATISTVRSAILSASPGASLEFRSLPTIIDDSARVGHPEKPRAGPRSIFPPPDARENGRA
jgi:hypothetical protein